MTTALRILRYVDFDAHGLERVTEKVVAALAQGDFAAAQVKKLRHVSLGKIYRARLNDADRLLFSLLRYQEEVVVLLLEVIRQHRYERSRFLRGAQIDSDKIVALPEAIAEAQDLPFLGEGAGNIHWLDKPLSFDDTQEALFRLSPPLILVGGAGSGKTALLLEKLKTIPGDVLYVTHSAYLAEHARDLYYAHGYQREEQEADFLSYRDYLETWRIPQGKELGWRDFFVWFQRARQGFKGIEAHQAFEEIRGVLSARPEGVLDRDSYLALGVRQSIFAQDQRQLLYSLFERYRVWLREAGLYDLNLLAQDWRDLVRPRYDFVVVDEAQDLTPIQLVLILRALRRPDAFLLGGDSNQIVHPNFFSWSQVKTLFWKDPQVAAGQALEILTHNFRNGREVTRISNRLLEIKQQRFGSIDRESNFLVEAVGELGGAVSLLEDQPKALAKLDAQTRRSTQYAVIVLRDEDKAAARQIFSTPLLFSVHEAKGLEYPHVILYRFVSDQRSAFASIAEGVQAADLGGDALAFRRAKDKGDKALEIYKFFVNALYVALTRARESVIWVESDHQHPLLSLLALSQQAEVEVSATAASMEEWQKEARKLELQGKAEQAEAIRNTLLHTQTPPWPVFRPEHLLELQKKVFVERVPGAKPRQQLLDYAVFYDDAALSLRLVVEAGFAPAQSFDRQHSKGVRAQLAAYSPKRPTEVLNNIDRYGLEYRSVMNATPLMMAARAGNIDLVATLLARGARRDAEDHLGRNACHWALRQAMVDPEYAHESLPDLWNLLAPPYVDINCGGRLLRLGRHLGEYMLFQSLWALLPSYPGTVSPTPLYLFTTDIVASLWQNFPASVVPEYRRQRNYLSGLLAKNEIQREYAYNRQLFRRMQRGWYVFQPDLFLRDPAQDGTWRNWVDAHGFPFLQQMAATQDQERWKAVLSLLRPQDLPEPPVTATASETKKGVHRAAQQRNENKRVTSNQAKGKKASSMKSAKKNTLEQQNLPLFDHEP
ncbi:MAG: UvrD-helicase domain-containing protein [Acidithiobacillus sp.]